MLAVGMQVSIDNVAAIVKCFVSWDILQWIQNKSKRLMVLIT